MQKGQCASGDRDLSAERSSVRLVRVWWWGLKCTKVSVHLVRVWCASSVRLVCTLSADLVRVW